MFGWLDRLRQRLASAGNRRERIPDDIQERIPLAAIDKVTFFKRDEITSDLICCEVEAAGRVWLFHEDAEGWDDLVRYLETLPGFRTDWFLAVSQPAFAVSETVAFTR